MRRWILTLALFSASPLLVMAEQSAPFEGATLIAQSEVVEPKHRVALSKVRRISGQLVLDRELAVAATLHTQTFELPANTVVTEAFNQVVATYSANAQLLYRCEGRDCGSSNLWANALFNNARLLGLDDQQGYAVLREQDQLVTIYSVMRGNRRAYMHLERIQSAAPLGEVLPEAATLTYQLQTQKLLNLGLSGEPSEDWVQLLATSLRRQVTLRVAVGGPFAQAWRDALVAAGVHIARLELADQPGEFLFLQALR